MNNKIFIFCLCLLSYTVVIPLTLFAASFDCGKAKSEVEKLICGNEELSKLDESLNDAYLKALNRTDIKKATIESQNQWLKKERNVCQDIECIKHAYENRIKELGLSSSFGLVFFRDNDQKKSIPDAAANLEESKKDQQCIENDQIKCGRQHVSPNESASNKQNVEKAENHKRENHVSTKAESDRTSIKKIDRSKLMSELLYSTSDYKTPPSNALVWSKLLLDLKIPGYSPEINSESPWTNNDCNYMNAIATLREIQSQLGKNSPYLKTWAANQDRVLLACQGKPEPGKPPIKSTGKSLPRRAQSDFLYQIGSWNFYQRNYEAALTNYQSAEKQIGTPQ
jgi:uncharacterized protein